MSLHFADTGEGPPILRIHGYPLSSEIFEPQIAIRGLRQRPDSSELLPKLKIPALVIVGSEDKITPVADAKRMAKTLPDSTLRVIEGAEHLSNLEKAAEFNTAVLEFLAT